MVYKTKRKFKATNDSNHNKRIVPNLLNRKFTVLDANCYWVGDITYVPTSEGWLYLATVIDLFSRKIIGYRSFALSKKYVNLTKKSFS